MQRNEPVLLLHRLTVGISLTGYLLVAMAGALLHDHASSHADCPVPGLRAQERGGSAATECGCVCRSGRPTATGERVPRPAPAPCEAPHDHEDCSVCQFLAHKVLTAPHVAVAGLSDDVESVAPLTAAAPILVVAACYDSRAPPHPNG